VEAVDRRGALVQDFGARDLVKRVPCCFGSYVRLHDQCDGDRRTDGTPCVLRDDCYGFQFLVDEFRLSGRPILPDDHLHKCGESLCFRKGSEWIIPAIDRVIVEHGIQDGRCGRAIARRAIVDNKQIAEELVRWFALRVSEILVRPVHELFGECDLGDLLLVDRTSRSNYVSLYARSNRGKVVVASIFPNRRAGKLRIKLPLRRDSVTMRKSVRVVPFEGCADGRFSIQFCGLDRRGTSVVAEIVAQAITNGDIAIDTPWSGRVGVTFR
jgi:hypothetical protein